MIWLNSSKSYPLIFGKKCIRTTKLKKTPYYEMVDRKSGLVYLMNVYLDIWLKICFFLKD